MSKNGADRRPAGSSAESLRRGWTTGACATAAAKAAYEALLTGRFPDPVTIRLPRGEEPSFALARTGLTENSAMASVIKDAGDDPDVTHGAEIVVTVRRLGSAGGVRFKAGLGVGTVTLAGLPVAPGEPAINPVPRKMIGEALAGVAEAQGTMVDVEVEISIPGGEALALKTWNPRLGIVGGLSILGTTGIVVPYSCAAWIHSIHRGIDVARAAGLDHVAGSTGNVSEQAVKERYDLPDIALLDMGDFAGGLLKYLRDHPLPRLTIAGGFGKMTKLAQGALDLHSSRSQVDTGFLAGLAAEDGADKTVQAEITGSNTAMDALERASQMGLPLAALVADRARSTAKAVLGEAPVDLNVLVVSRDGVVVVDTGRG